MPTVYLLSDVDPSSINSDEGLEKYYVNLILQEIAECLNSSGIKYISAPENANADLPSSDLNDTFLFTLKINSLPGPLPSQTQGINIFFVEGVPESKRMALILGEHLKNLYPESSMVKLISLKPTEIPGEHNVPYVILGIGYNQSPDDMLWLRQNTEEIAKAAVMSFAEYFGLPFLPCVNSSWGITTEETALMARPAQDASIIDGIPVNTRVEILGQWENWYVTDYNNNIGYVPSEFIRS